MAFGLSLPGIGGGLPGLDDINDIIGSITDEALDIASVLNDIRHRVADTQVMDELVEPSVQGAVMVFDTPYQFTQAGFRTALRRYREGGGGWQGLANVPATTPSAAVDYGLSVAAQSELTAYAGQGTAHLLGLDVVAPTLGDGFFIEGNLRDTVESQRRAQGLIHGQGITIGRWVASPLEPGSTEHTLLSGFTDAAIALAGPGELAIGRSLESAVAARHLRTAARPSTRAIIETVGEGDEAVDVIRGFRAATTREHLFQDWGGLRHARPTYDAQRVAHALDTPLGRRTIETIADSDAFTIRNLFKGKVDGDVLRVLGEADDASTVRHILQSELGTHIMGRPKGQMRRGLGSLFETARESSIGRTAARLVDHVPGRWVDLENPTRVLDQVDSSLNNLRLSSASRRRWINRFTAATARHQREELLK
ncbi:MAG: hypothetical protein GY773_00875 [Actinomycetia bacterium]|nr:hypothetical protein [Actinomycetes bacterium]